MNIRTAANERMKENAPGRRNNMCKGPEMRISLICFRNSILIKLE